VLAVKRLCLCESQGEKGAREIDIDAVLVRQDHLLAWSHMTPHDSRSEVRLNRGGVVLQTEGKQTSSGEGATRSRSENVEVEFREVVQ
jgi:hypothetical protein